MHHPEKIKIAFFDIDETLYIKSEKRIPHSVTEEVLPRLKAKGIIPAIATGRCFGAFPEALKPFLHADGFESLVTINGQHNQYRDTLISHYPLPNERIDEAISHLNRLNLPYGLVGHHTVAVSANAPIVAQSLSPITAQYQIDPQLHHREPIYQLLAFYPEAMTQTVMESGVLGHDLKIVRWHPHAVDFLHQHHSKAMGIDDVLQRLGLHREHAMAFGDGLNDIEMLSTVGFGVAMGNGDPQVKAVADYVTRPIEQDGILHALEQLGVI